jgi:hypothetical protein
MSQDASTHLVLKEVFRLGSELVGILNYLVQRELVVLEEEG